MNIRDQYEMRGPTGGVRQQGRSADDQMNH